MREIFYLTRTYLPERSGGIMIRAKACELLQNSGFSVRVITPNYEKKQIEVDGNILRVPLTYPIRQGTILQRFGIWEDYLDGWARAALKLLKQNTTKNSIYFATSGGEIGCIKLGALLKKYIGGKFIINFHDPIDYSLVNGLRIDKKFHVSREKIEKKYLAYADLIITSSQANADSLNNKYPLMKNKIVNNYFGYIDRCTPGERIKHAQINIAYVGVFDYFQAPEILARICDGIEGIHVYYIGNSTHYEPLYKYRNSSKVTFIPFLAHDKFVEFMLTTIDVGFVSLGTDYLGACVPSKIYEYINLGIPILGALPGGDANEIINQNRYGIACKYDDYESLRKAVMRLQDSIFWNDCRNNILTNREAWSMENKIQEVVDWLKAL